MGIGPAALFNTVSHWHILILIAYVRRALPMSRNHNPAKAELIYSRFNHILEDLL